MDLEILGSLGTDDVEAPGEEEAEEEADEEEDEADVDARAAARCASHLARRAEERTASAAEMRRVASFVSMFMTSSRNAGL